MHLSKLKGTLVNFSHFAEVINDILQVDEWQLEIRKHNNDPYEVDELVVYVTPQAGANQSTLSQLIKDKINGATEVSPNEVKFIPLDEMVKRLPPEERVKGMSAEELLRALSPEVLAALVRQAHHRQAPPGSCLRNAGPLRRLLW